MNFEYEISRVDCISKENYFSHFNIQKYISVSLETPSFLSIFAARKTLSARSTPMHLVYKKHNYSFSVHSVDNSFTNTRRSSYGRTALSSY